MSFLRIFQVIITLGDTLHVFLKRCKCGRNNMKTIRDYDGKWFVQCSSGNCRMKTPRCLTRRRAKRSWNWMVTDGD